MSALVADSKWTPTAHLGTCRSCMKKTQVYRITRRGGGNYRRAGRRYRSSICGPCAVHLHENGWSERFDRLGLRDIAEKEMKS